MHWLTYGIDIMLAVIFMTALYSKGSNVGDFQLSIASYKVLPSGWIAAASWIVLGFELLLVILFVFGSLLYVKEIAAVVLMLFFTGLLLYKRYRNNNVAAACSCFGTIEFLNRYPVMRNLIIAGFATGKCLLPLRSLPIRDNLWISSVVMVVLLSSFVLVDVLSTFRKYKEMHIGI